jgi:hypothetical protein
VALNRVSTRWGALAATVTCGIAGAAIMAGPAAASAVPGRPSPGSVVLVACLSKGTVRPSRYILACADGNAFLKGLSWTSWTPNAHGTGKEAINLCVPSCVAGHFHTYPLTVTLWRVRPWPHHQGKRYFTRMTLHYTKKVPRGVHRKNIIKLSARG